MPTEFGKVRSNNPGMRGSPLHMNFGQSSNNALKHMSEVQEEDFLIINSRFPTFRNEHADCLRTGLLSALHYIDPECRVDMPMLRKALCGDKHCGTDIATAVLFLSTLGVTAIAYASSLDRITKGPRDMALEFELLKEQRLTPQNINGAVYNGDIVICGISPAGLFEHAYDCSHAMLITGIGQRLVAAHNSMRPDWALGSHGDRNAVFLWEEIEKGRAMHDFHTIAISGKVKDLDYHRDRVRKMMQHGADYAPKLVAMQEHMSDPDYGPKSEDPELIAYEEEQKHVIPRIAIHTVPFVRTHTKSSMAASVLSAIRYHKRRSTIDIRKMSRLVGQTNDLHNAARALDKLGYRYSSHSLNPAAGQRRTRLTQKVMRSALRKGHLPICLVDFNKLKKNAPHKKLPHATVVVGYDYGQLLVHQSGITRKGSPNIPYNIIAATSFEKARARGYDTLIVKGPKVQLKRKLTDRTPEPKDHAPQ